MMRLWPTRHWLLVGVVGVGLGSCEPRPAQLAAAGAQPSTIYYVGPQPGPDRAMPMVTNPFAGDPTALAEGRRLFVWYNCAGCHGDHGGGGMGPSLRDATWIYGGDDQHIFASVAEGRANGMPAWGPKLPEEQIWKIAAYIRSLRTSYEPSPPH
jgi:cytochrome c oxidase cbb3-type subunit 3